MLRRKCLKLIYNNTITYSLTNQKFYMHNIAY